MSNFAERVKRRDNSRRSRSPTKPTVSGTSRRGRRSIDPGCSNQGEIKPKEITDECERSTETMSTATPTETTSTSSLSTACLVQQNMCTLDEVKSNDDNDIVRIDVMNEDKAPEPLPPGDGAMIEVAKITALVEEELQSQRRRHKDHLNRTVTKYKGRIENFQIEVDKIRAERDKARAELEECKHILASQTLAAEQSDSSQSQQNDEIEMLAEQKELVAQLEKERDDLLEEVANAKERQKRAKNQLTSLKDRVREDSQKRLSVMEALSASWDTEKKEAKQREAVLSSELEMMSKTLKAEQENLKRKNKSFNELESQYRSIRAELKSVKKSSAGGRNDDLEDELREERELREKLSEEHEKILRIKNEEIKIAENTIRSMEAELESARENFHLREESMNRSIAEMKQYNENDNNEASNPEVQMLQEENLRLNKEVKELHKQVESYLANMALQQEFCNSLKSRIYTEQETEHEQIEELHRLRKQLKKEQRASAEKDLRIEELEELLNESTCAPVKVNERPSSSRNVTGEKKSKTKKPKTASRRNSTGM